MSKILNEKIAYDGKRFNVTQRLYEREDGIQYERDCVNPGNAVVILPINDNNEIVFITQYRDALGKVALELPAGMIDDGELPEHVAIRELEEETGIKTDKVEFLTECYPSPGYTSEKIYIFLARNFQKGTKHLDETEEIFDVKKISIDECMRMLKNNEFEYANVIIALYEYFYRYCK